MRKTQISLPRIITGEQFAGYQILFPCRHGAFEEVYLAVDMLGHRVALKVFSAVHAGEVDFSFSTPEWVSEAGIGVF